MSVALLLSALAMGLFGSTHCVAMCGGVVGVLSGGTVALETSARASFARRTRLALAYNAGRIASYAIAGTVAGAFGALVDRVPFLHGAQLAMRLAAGLLMVGLGLYLAGLWRRFALIERLGVPVWKRVEPFARRLLPVRSLPSALALGALWGWMPCGLVYAALAVALGTSSPATGGAAMIAFGLGTLPMLLTMGALATRVVDAMRRPWIRQAAGAAILSFGLLHVAAASAQIGSGPSAPHACCPGHHGDQP